MTVLITIGDFSRMTHLSVKALRHYHDVGLLEPAEVDRSSGYRFYEPSQVPIAQVIRRFRDLGMPVDEVRAVLNAPDVTSRNQVIVAHLERMEEQLAADPGDRVLTPGRPGRSRPRRRRSNIAAWARPPPWPSGRRSPRPTWSHGGPTPSSPSARPSKRRAYPGPGRTAVCTRTRCSSWKKGKWWPSCRSRTTRPDRAGCTSYELPAVELAIMVHPGTYDELDRTYGALGTYVAERAIGVEGPIRELYVVSPLDVEDPADLRTELGWPVFRAG